VPVRPGSAALGVVHPFLYVGRYRVFHGEGFAQYVEVFDVGVDQLLQGTALDFEVVGGSQFLRHDQVVAGLGFVGVGDGGGADFEVALGLFQLLGDRSFLVAFSCMVSWAISTSK